MAWDAGTITSATPWAALSAKIQALVGGSGVANWSYVKNIPAGTSAGQSGSASYSLDLFRCRGATNLYNRAVQVNLSGTTTTSNTDATSYAFTVTLPAASRFFTLCVINSKASAADDPASCTFNGTNGPTFTKIKSQASGAGSGELKMTVWIGKTSASAPSGATTLTVDFSGATQTGCMIILDQWDGCDLTLGADGLDATGATKIGIAATGANGTTQTVHGVTMGSYLGAQSVVIQYSASDFTATGGTYTNKAGWVYGMSGTIATTVAPILDAKSQWRPNTGNAEIDLAPSMTISTATNETSWAAIGFEFQRTTSATSITNANDLGRDWYFVLEIPVPDGVVNSSFNGFEDYDGNELFRRGVALIPGGAVTPDQTDWTISPTLGPYGGTINGITAVTNNARSNLTHQTLTTSSFNYWIKLTPNLIWVATRVGASEKCFGVMLLDSFVTNQTDFPLVAIQNTTSATNGTCMTRLPGVTASITTGAYSSTCRFWTTAALEGFTTNASAQQDFWASGKVHASRIFFTHTMGRVAGNSGANNWGYAKGLWKSDLLAIKIGGTVSIGDTMTIAGNTWTVVSPGATTQFFGSTGSDSMIVFARAN